MGVAERKVREKVARRSTILAAAREVFAERGLVNGTMDGIAEKAELSKGAIYLYFPSKEELYLSVMDEGMDILIRRLLSARDPSLPADKALEKMALAYYQFYLDYPDYFRIMFLYQHLGLRERVRPEFMADCDAKSVTCLNIVREIIEKGMDEGMFRRLNPWTMAALCWTSLNGIIMLGEHLEHLPKRMRQELTPGSVMEAFWDVFMEGLVRPRRA